MEVEDRGGKEDESKRSNRTTSYASVMLGVERTWVKGKPVISIASKMVEEMGNQFKWMMRGGFFSDRKSLQQIHEAVEDQIEKELSFQVATINQREVLLRFSSDKEYLQVLSKNMIVVEEAMMQLFRWSMTLNPVVDERRVMVFWTKTWYLHNAQEKEEMQGLN